MHESVACVQAVLLPLARGTLAQGGRGSTPQPLVEAAQECLADLCVFPGFLQEMYSSLDCRVECSNLFEDICSVRIPPDAPCMQRMRGADAGSVCR